MTKTGLPLSFPLPSFDSHDSLEDDMASGPDAEPGSEVVVLTFTYKRFLQNPGIELTVDAAVPLNGTRKRSPRADCDKSGVEDSTEETRMPVLVFFHGGALVAGNKIGWLSGWLLSQCSPLLAPV